MSWKDKIKDRVFLKKIGVSVAVLALLYSILGFFILPWIIRPIIEEKAGEALDRKVTVENLAVNPWVLSATITGLAVKDADGADFIRVGEIYGNLQAWSLPSLSATLKKISLIDPYARVVRNEDGSFNFSDLLDKYGPKKGEAPAPKNPEESPFPLHLALLQVHNASLLVEDRVKGIDHEIKDASFSVSKFSTLPHHQERDVLFDLALAVNDTRVTIKATSHPFDEDQDATLDVKVLGVNLARYMAYAPLPSEVNVSSAFLDLETTVDFAKDEKGEKLMVSGTVTLSDLMVKEGQAQPLVSVKKTILELAPTRLFARDLHVAAVRVMEPRLHVLRDGKGKTNLEKILASVQDHLAKEFPEPKPEPDQDKPVTTDSHMPGPSAEDPPPELKFVVDRVELNQGQVFFADQSTAPSFSTSLTPVSVTLTNLSNKQGTQARYEVTMATNKGETITALGNLGLVPLGAQGSASVSSVRFADYFPYYQPMLHTEPLAGAVTVRTEYAADLANMNPGEIPNVVLTNLAVLVDGLAIRPKGGQNSVVIVPDFSLLVQTVDLPQQNIVVSEMSTKDGRIDLALENDGQISLMSLVKLPESAPAQAGANTPASAQPTPWTVDVENIQVDGYDIDFTDNTLSQPARVALGDLRFSASGFSTREGVAGEVDFFTRFQQTGSIQASGAAGVQPLAANLDVLAKGIDLASFQPYFQDQIQVKLTKGHAQTKGKVSFRMDQTTPKPKISFTGEAAILEFASADKVTGEDFFNFQSLHLANIQAGTEPLAVSVDKIGLDDFYSRIIIYSDGSINLKNILPQTDEEGETEQKKPEKAVPPEPRKPLPADFEIKEITLTKGRFNFTDNFIKPNYSANYTDMAGSIAGLSTREGSRAKVNLEGQIGSHAPVTVNGEINPLIPNVFADVQVKVSDLELPALSPYSGRFVGKLIEKGKLSSTVSYKVEDNQLAGENRIIIDQFTFGRDVESEDATSLPVGLAISLLKDRNGVIDLDFAVSGDMNDPSFSVAKIVLKVISNLITKIVTSPFSMLGSVFGGGEDLEFIDFTPGSVELSAESIKKLDALEEALYERPGLTLEMRGDVDLAADVEAVREMEFQNLLKRQMLGDPEAEAGALGEVVIPQEKYLEILQQAFDAAGFPKPLDPDGNPREVLPGEMEKLLRTHVQVTDSQLRILAHRRSLASKEYMLGKKRVEPGRVFILEVTPMDDKEDRRSRVRFSIR